MKIVIAPDSFKESLSAPDVAAAIARGWQQVFPDAECLLRPMADGGEGTVDALLAAVGGERRECRVRGPMGEPVVAHWGWLGEGTAVIEMAAASGLHWVPREQRDARLASSYGTGELIREALDAGATRIILGLGGSATNDAGVGLLQALGMRFLDAQGRDLAPGGAALAELDQLDLSGLDARLLNVQIDVAADVDNPLCGPRGASAVFGPQKGATPEHVAQLDQALGRFARVTASTLGEDHAEFPGVGAAGGLGFAARGSSRPASVRASSWWPSCPGWRLPCRGGPGDHRGRADGCADAARQDAGRRGPRRACRRRAGDRLVRQPG